MKYTYDNKKKIGRTQRYIGNYCFTEAVSIDRYELADFEEENLTGVICPKVTSIGEAAFFKCFGLTETDFPEVITIEKRGFYGCVRLKTATFPKTISIGVEAFSYTAISEGIFKNAKSLGKGSFEGCKKLCKMHLPKVEIIEEKAFAFCTRLVEMMCPKTHTVKGIAFEHCSELKIAYFPQAIIEDLAFLWCPNLKYIVSQNENEMRNRYEDTDADEIFPEKVTNATFIATKDFDPRLLGLDDPTIVQKLYSKGPHIAKALLSFASSDFSSEKDLHALLKNTDNVEHKDIHDLIPSETILQKVYNFFMSSKKTATTPSKKEEKYSHNNSGDLASDAFKIVSLHFNKMTTKDYRHNKLDPEIQAIKTLLMGKTGINEDDLSSLKTHYESLVSKTLNVANPYRDNQSITDSSKKKGK